MEKESYFRNRDEFDESYDDFDDFGGPGLNEPKRSPMRRKEKFKTKDFQTEKKHKDRKRGYRNKIQHDFGFWEE